MGDAVYIYALLDPRKTGLGAVRYVGKARDPDARLSKHLDDALREETHKARWLRQLRLGGIKPKVVILEQVAEETWQEAERRHITFMRLSGAPLTNMTEGGDGSASPSSETRARMSAAQKNLSLEKRLKVSAATRAYWARRDTRAHWWGSDLGDAEVQAEIRSKLAANHAREAIVFVAEAILSQHSRR